MSILFAKKILQRRILYAIIGLMKEGVILEIGSRVKILRKELGLNQTEFGEKIGFKQAAIGLWENGQRAISDSAILLICEKYNVSETWLRTGKGEMFKRDEDAAVSQLAHEFSLSTLGQAIIRSYLHLGDAEKAVIGEYIKSVAQEYERADTVRISSNEDIDPDIKKELDSYRQELEQEKSTQTSSVSQDTGKDAI